MKPSPCCSAAALLLMALLTGCTKTEPAAQPEPAAEPRREENVVSLTTENLSHVTIKTETVSRGSLELRLKAVGRLSEDLNKTARVTSTLEGRLTRLNYDLNQPVKAGDVVGLVQTPELLGRLLELKAPIDGVITERNSTAGELIGKDTQIYTISDPTDLWVLAEIKERDIGAVRVGQEASFTVLSYPGETFHGKVVLLGNRVEPGSRTLEVRIATFNTEGRLKPGMFADVEITTTAIREALTIPDTALQSLEDEAIVFVALSDMKFEKRVIKTGMEQRGRIQVLEGVQEGEKVVTDGSFILKSELLKGELGEE